MVIKTEWTNGLLGRIIGGAVIVLFTVAITLAGTVWTMAPRLERLEADLREIKVAAQQALLVQAKYVPLRDAQIEAIHKRLDRIEAASPRR